MDKTLQVGQRANVAASISDARESPGALHAFAGPAQKMLRKFKSHHWGGMRRVTFHVEIKEFFYKAQVTSPECL
eukprot:1143607-Pelagomonas_calceolata.AAC.1